MSYNDVPAKVLDCFVVNQTGYGAWPYDDGTGDPFWAFGSTPRDYRWRITVQVNSQRHSSHKTREPRVYNGMDVAVGDYIASASDGVALRIVRIDAKTSDLVTCVVEDVFRYNTFRDGGGLGHGLFTVPTNAVIFEVNESGIPVVDPLPSSGVGPTFYANLMSRFQNVEKAQNFTLEMPSHGFQVGQMISADDNNNDFTLTTSQHPFMIGRVSFVENEDTFTVTPIQRIVDDLDYLPGEVGSVLYADPNVPGGLSLTGLNPVMVKLREYSNTVVIGTTANASSTPGSVMTVNGTDVTIMGTGDLDDLLAVMTPVESQTGVKTRIVLAPNALSTNPSLVNPDFGEPLLVLPGPPLQNPSAVINGVTVEFDSFSDGQARYGMMYATAVDMARDINAAAIPHVVASATATSLTITEVTGGTITIQNGHSDWLGRKFAGSVSASGLSLTSSASRARLVRMEAVDARPINLANKVGSPLDDYGIYSVENGVKAAALFIEQGIRKAATYVVPNMAARDALSQIAVGDQAYVLDKGDGDWGLFLNDGSTWTKIAAYESAKVDSDTYSAEIAYVDTGTATLGDVGAGSKITLVTVEVVEGFDGAPSITVGVDGNPDLLVTDDQVDLTTIGSYIVMPTYIFGSSDEKTVKVFTSAVGSTKGRLVVQLTYQ